MDFVRERAAAPLAVVLSAVLFYFGTGLAPVPVLTWLAPLPILLLAPRVSAGTAAWTSFTAFLLGTANSWVFQLHSHDEPMVPVGLVINLGSAVTFLLAVLLFRALVRSGWPLLAAGCGAALWTGVMYLVSVANPQGLVGTFAGDQADVPVVVQTASVTGMWGVEFLVLFAPAALAALLTPGVTGRIRVGVVAGVVLAGALGAGAVRLSQHDGDVRRVAAIAPNTYAWAPDVDSAQGNTLVHAYVRAIDALPAGVRTVVLPEGAFGADRPDPAALVAPLSAAAKARDVDIVVGLQQGRNNLALVFPATGAPPADYLKHHNLGGAHGDTLVYDPADTGVEICADVDFASPSRDYANSGTQLLAIPASDNDANGWQHSRTALLRGAENGQAVVWAGQNGELMIADGLGRVLADAHTGGPGRMVTIVADPSVGPGATAYSRLGDWFAWLCLALTAIGVIVALRARRLVEPEPVRLHQG